MTIIPSKHVDGWRGIRDALARAVPGCVVRPEPGVYDSPGTLRLSNGVALDGLGVVLRHTGQGPAVEARGIADVSIRGLRVEMLADDVPVRLEPDVDAYPSGEGLVEWGLIWLDRVEDGIVADVIVRAAHGPYDAVTARNCQGIAVDRIDVEGVGRRGIGMVSSTNCCVEGSRAARCGQAGIWLDRAQGSKGLTSCRIAANRCHDNGGEGIRLHSSAAPAIENNECWANGTVGIALGQDPTETSSSADSITANRCYDNAHVGIGLQSSEALRIENNDCWGNGVAGVALWRSPASSDAPSASIIAANRCHDNGGTGISLQSSNIHSIEGNDCWGNRNLGIALEYGWESDALPSSATIPGNRCHDNGGAGIALFSSTAPAIAHNDCWRNGTTGISLERSLESRDSISSNATIKGNRCHHNWAGIALQSSNACVIENNDCWENRTSGIGLNRNRSSDVSKAAITENWLSENGVALLVERGGAEVTRFERNCVWGNRVDPSWAVRETENALSPVAPFEGSFLPAPPAQEILRRRDAARAARLACAQHGALVRRFEAEGLVDAEALAAFIAGHGCAGCLARWFDPEAPRGGPVEPAAVPRPAEPPVPDPARARRYRCLHEAPPPRLRFRVERDEEPEAALWAAIAEAAVAGGSNVRIGLVTGEAGLFDRLGADVVILRRLISGHDGDPSRMSPAARPIAHQLREAGARIADPVVLDHLPRSRAALSGRTAALPLFEEALLEGRSRWAEAAKLLARTPRAWRDLLGSLALLAAASFGMGVLKDAPGGWRDPLDAALHAWRVNLDSLQLLDVLALPVTTLAFVGLLISAARRHLPAALRPPLPDKLGAWLKVAEDGAPARGSPWRRWVGWRLYGRGLGVVVVRGAEEWSAEDAAALREALALRPPGRSLVLSIHAASRGLVDRAVLRPLALRSAGETGGVDDSAAPDLAALDGLGLVVGRPPEPVTLPDQREPGATGPLRTPLPETDEGLADLLGLRRGDASRLRPVMDRIADRRWSPHDLVPMLVVGSTVDAPFVLSQRAIERDEALAEKLLPYVRMLEGDPSRTLELPAELKGLDDRLEEAERSRAVHVASTHHPDGRVTLSLIGQAGRRQRMVDHLALAFEVPERRRDYVLGLLACGLLHAMRAARVELEAGPAATAALRAALRSLRSANRLTDEIAVLGGLDAARQRMLDEERDQLAGVLAAANLVEEPSEVEDAERVRLASVLACRADRMGLLDAAGQLSATQQTPLVAALSRRVVRAARLRCERDPAVACTLALGAVRAERREADDDLWNALWSRVKAAGDGPALCELVWRIPDAEALRALLRDHVDMGGVATAGVLLQLAGRDEATALRAARLLERCRERGVAVARPPRGYQRRMEAPGEAVDRLLSWLEETATIDVLVGTGATELDDLPEIELGYFDPYDQRAGHEVELVFEEAPRLSE